jgi:hypothetical protein
MKFAELNSIGAANSSQYIVEICEVPESCPTAFCIAPPVVAPLGRQAGALGVPEDLSPTAVATVAKTPSKSLILLAGGPERTRTL